MLNDAIEIEIKHHVCALRRWSRNVRPLGVMAAQL